MMSFPAAGGDCPAALSEEISRAGAITAVRGAVAVAAAAQMIAAAEAAALVIAAAVAAEADQAIGVTGVPREAAVGVAAAAAAAAVVVAAATAAAVVAAAALPRRWALLECRHVQRCDFVALRLRASSFTSRTT